MAIQEGSAKPLSERAADDIARYIIENGLAPGDKLPTEPKLSAMLGVGRGTVREAVKALVSRNVLTVRQGAGTFVAERLGVADDPLGLAFARDKYKLAVDMFQVRMMIEPEVAAMAAGRATGEEIVRLRGLCTAVEEAIADGKDHAAADQDFHRHIARCSGNGVVETLVPMIHPSIELFVDLTHRGLLRETVETHRELLDAITARDSLRARDAMRLHLMYNKRSMEKFRPRG